MPKSNKDTELDKILTDFYWAVENDIGGEPKFAPEPVKQAKQAIQDLIDKEVRKARKEMLDSLPDEMDISEWPDIITSEHLADTIDEYLFDRIAELNNKEAVE